MHDRAVRLAGAVKSAAVIAIEIMILLKIDLRITRVRPYVEGKRSWKRMLTKKADFIKEVQRWLCHVAKNS